MRMLMSETIAAFITALALTRLALSTGDASNGENNDKSDNDNDFGGEDTGIADDELSTTFFKRRGGIDVSSHRNRTRLYDLLGWSSSTTTPAALPWTTLTSYLDRPDEDRRLSESQSRYPNEYEPRFWTRRPSIWRRTTERSFSVFDQEEKDLLQTSLNPDKPILKVGIVIPHQFFHQRRNQAIVSRSLSTVLEAEFSTTSNNDKYKNNTSLSSNNIKNHFNFVWSPTTSNLFDPDDSINFKDLAISPPPADITSLLCQQMKNGSSAIIYFTNREEFGRTTAASQYFLKMAGFLGIPVIAWNADNTGLDKVISARGSDVMTGHLQMAPSLHHQVKALLSILERYGWRQFGVLTTEIAGHDDFVQAIRDKIKKTDSNRKYVMQGTFKTSEAIDWDLSELKASEVRIIILYCTQAEASIVMTKANETGLTSSNYMWLVTQSVIGDATDIKNSYRKALPPGMMGVSFPIKVQDVMEDFITLALHVFLEGAEQMISSEEEAAWNYQSSCEEVDTKTKWSAGAKFYEYMKNVRLGRGAVKKQLRGKKLFNEDGTTVDAELNVLNFKPGSRADDQGQWEVVGTWSTWNGLDIKDIVWPGGNHVPPEGVPEKFHMKITFLEEPPFIIISEPDPVTKKCTINRGVPCYLSENLSSESKCCSGMCIDLLRKFEEDLGFTYDLVRVNDTKFGTFHNGHWNGLMGTLVAKETDMVLSALKINAQRESAVDFTVPFLESGIAIAVAKRTGIISPTAFLEPFDFLSWLLVAVVAIQAAALAIFLFEWLSPLGYDMKINPPQEGHRFSLFRTYWLVWAVLFQASVKIDCPRGYTARFMSIVWAIFAVVFLALYTANLAAFMIPREEYFDFSGIEDPRIINPLSHKPGLRYATIPYSYTEATLQKHHPEIYDYTKRFQHYGNTADAIKAVKNGSLDAFIYDGTVLRYLASQDDECRLLQVGSWSALTGYALAFPMNSKYKEMFNDEILELRENGVLERLSRFWMSGGCKPNEQEKRASEPLSIAQFLSAFLLLGIGTFIAVLLLILEHVYVKYLHDHIGKSSKSGCFSLISMSIGRSEHVVPNADKCDSDSDDSGTMDVKKALEFICKDGECRDLFLHLQTELHFAKKQIRMLENQLSEADEDHLLMASSFRDSLSNHETQL